MAYMVNVTAPTAVYVSSVSANGIPVGDNTNGGGISAPVLTLDQGIAILHPSGGTVYANGTTGSPTTYTITSGSITKAMTLRGVTSRGASIAAGTGTTYALQVAPTAGQTVTLRDLIVDAALNTAGVATNGIGLTAQSTAYTFVSSNCAIKGFTASSGASGIVGLGTFKGNITLSSTDITGATCDSGVYVGTYNQGAFTMTGGSVTLTNQRTNGRGGIVLQANAAGVTSSISGATMHVSIDTSLTSTGYHYGIFTENVTATVSAVTSTVDGQAGQRQGFPVWVSTSGSPQDISGSTVTGCTGYLDCYNGIVLIIGSDSTADQTKRQNCTMSYNMASASATAITNGAHGTMMGFTGTGSVMSYNTSGPAALPFVDKENLGLTMTYNTGSDATSSMFLCKGSTNTAFNHNTGTQHSGYTGNFRYIEVNNGTGTNSTGIVDADNAYTNAGAAGPYWVLIDASQTATFARDSYTLSSGSQHSPAFSYLGTGKTPAQWQATVEPTATGNIF